MPSIVVKIPYKGITQGQTKTNVETNGFVGAQCQIASGLITGALGAVSGEKLKEEFFTCPEPPLQVREEGEEPK